MTPDQLQTAVRSLGESPPRPVRPSRIAFGCSRASFIHAPLISSDSSFLTCSGRSSARNHISSSTRVPSSASHVSVRVMGALYTTFAEPVFREPVEPGLQRGGGQLAVGVSCCHPTSTDEPLKSALLLRPAPDFQQQPTDLPEPMGPLMPRTSALLA